MRRLNWKLISISVFFLFCWIAAESSASAQDWSNGYGHRRTITIYHTQVPNTDQTNFPVLISGTYSYLASTSNGGQVTSATGYDIIFTSDAAGTFPLPFERQSYTAASGHVNFWVTVPTLSHTTDTVIYMFYGNSSVTTDQSNKTAAWDSNYKGVWHLQETSGQQYDSTSNGNNSTAVHVTAEGTATGEIGGADQFNASNPDHVDLPNIVLSSAFTLEAWIYPTTIISYGRIVAKAYTSNAAPYVDYSLTFDTAADQKITLGFDNAGTFASLTSTGSVTLNQWNHIVGTYDGSYLRLFINGVQDSSYAQTGTVAAISQTTEIGYNSVDGPESFTGNIDEVRISASARSADWVSTEYNNQTNPSSFYSIDAADWSNGYAYQRTITIAHTQVPNTDQANFPLLISGTYAYLASSANGGQVTNANGYDIIFTSDAGGSLPLPYERETYSAATGAVDFWVKVPTVSHTTDTVIYMFYGNSAVTTDQSNPTCVWDAWYKGVWHLANGTTLSAVDSTSNSNNGSLVNSPTAVAGQIDGGANLASSSSQYITVPDNSSLKPASFTFSFWMKRSGNQQQYAHPLGKGGGSGAPYGAYYFQLNESNSDSSEGSLYVGTTNNVANQISYPSGSFSTGVWYYIVGTFNSSTKILTGYNNGVQEGTTTAAVSTVSYDTGALSFGRQNSYGQYFNGTLDEIRISNIPRSADWIATEFNNQSSPSTFYTLGASVQAPTLTSLSPNAGSAGTSVTIIGSNFGSTQGSSTVSFTGVPTTPTSWSTTQVVAPVPSGTISGNVALNVSNLYSNGLTFTDTSAGLLTLSPAFGSIGTTVTITGMNFGSTQGSSTITFNGVAATPTSWSNTQIVTTIPSGTSSGFVVVTVAGTVSNGLYFAVVVPTTTSLSPSSGTTGTSITINGSNFGASQLSSTVTFNGASATPTSWSNTQIVTPVPAAATNGNVVVTVGVVSSSGVSFSVVPNITGLSPLSGLAGTAVTITGTGFGPSQGSSTIAFNGATATPISWSDTSIVVSVPSGASTGNVVLNVGGFNSLGALFDVLPTGWLDQDIGTVGLAGSAAYSNGTFTIKGAGSDINGTADAFHFVYQPLSGNGTIIARVLGITGGNSSYEKAGVMIRETLTSGSTNAITLLQGQYGTNYLFSYRPTTSASTTQTSTSVSGSPYWVKVIRSGSSFSGYISNDGQTWTQVGTTQTISMATNVYFGLAVTSQSTSSLATANFDNVSVTSAAVAPPVITSLSGTTGPIGSYVDISGTGFGTTQGASTVLVNDLPASISSWSSTSITITIPTGATSGYLAVCVNPSMNCSNPVYFTITSQPLPLSWLDQDIGPVGILGSATYSNGTFTIKGAGADINGTADAFHFVYQPLSGDGTIIARVLGVSGGNGSYEKAGVMIRETLTPGSTNAFTFEQGQYGDSYYFDDRPTTSASTTQASVNYGSFPYWLKVTRSGTSFSGYISPDGSSWTQLGSTQTISMATDVYIGLALTSQSTSSLATATFDNVSISTTATPAPVITSVSATTGTIGTQVTISGSNFGASQGNSLVTLGALPMTVNSWSNTSISITIASGAASGLMVVSVAPSMNDSNPVYFTITSQALPSGWLDTDIGSVGIAGSAGYSSGTFTIKGAGADINGTADAFHFAYQALSGDGTIIARVVTLTGGTSSLYEKAGVMIRETLTSGSTNAFTFEQGPYGNSYYFDDRPTTSASTTQASLGIGSFPYWLKVTRSGTSFSGYISPDGSTWTQVGTTQTISMATNVYIGLGLTSNTTSALATATFDNVTITPGTSPLITGISPTGGGIGVPVTISGSYFGNTQGSSSVLFNGATATTVTSWSNTQIVANVPSTATTGFVTVVENGIGSDGNYVFTVYNPVISNLAPPSAPVGGSIIINGTGFGGVQGTVQFNSLNANITSWNNTSITATVPTGASSGPVTVTSGGITSNSVQFSLIESASITGISPSSAPIGASVVFTGTGFGPSQSDSVLWFNGGPVTTITSWSDTSITAVVPPNAATGYAMINVAGITTVGPAFTLSATSTTTDSLGNTTDYASQFQGGQWLFTVSQGSGCSSCSARGNIVSTYDSLGNLLSTTDPLGNVTTNTYDSSNDLLTQSQKLNSTTTATTTYTYNSFGEVLTVTDPIGNVTTNTYDANGNLLTVTSPKPNSGTAASVTTFGYNSLGELTTITDPLSHVTTMTYTTAGLIATITDAQNNVTTYGYDSKGNRTSVTDALSHTTTFAYDAMNRLTTITYPDSTTSSFTYDIRGRRTSTTDQNGKTTTYVYDDADRLTSVTDPAQHTTYYAYDTENNLTSITDANSNQTAFTYDAFGRVTNTNFPSSLSETYEYDADNNLTQKTDRKGQTIQYLYDALNRLTQKTYPDSTTVEYTYDLVGKILQVNDPSGTYAFAYDNMGRMIGTTTSYSFLTTRNFTNAYTYDAASNRTGFTDPEGGSTGYTYDALNRLTSLAPPSAFGSGSFGFSYDALSRRTQMTRPNSVATNYTYDNLSHLTSVLHQLSGSTIDGASYTLDSVGNRTAKTDQLAGVTSNYTYDAIYELTQVTQANNTTESYNYDPVGNRTASLGVSSYTTNASNEMTATSNASYTYDSNGNTLTKVVGSNTTTYAWDYENRLTSVTLPGTGGTVTFMYDPVGRRIEKVSPTFTSIFAYDGDNLIETTNSSGGVVARYTQTQNIDEPLEELRSSTTSFYEADGLGSISSLTNAAGSVADTYTYDSYGNLTASSGSVSNPFSYTGREFDSETGLYYYRNRYYDSQSGRFTGEDPLLFGGGDANFYAYVGGSPTDFVDPSGLERLCLFSFLCPDEHILQPPKYAHSDELPSGSRNYTAPGGQTFSIPSSADFCKEYATAQKIGLNPLFIKLAVGQGGAFDYQRDTTKRIVYGPLQEAANFSVGVYMNGAGYPRWATVSIALGFAATNASNFKKPGQVEQWIKWWDAGWDAANSGAYSGPNCGCNGSI